MLLVAPFICEINSKLRGTLLISNTQSWINQERREITEICKKQMKIHFSYKSIAFIFLVIIYRCALLRTNNKLFIPSLKYVAGLSTSTWNGCLWGPSLYLGRVKVIGCRIGLVRRVRDDLKLQLFESGTDCLWCVRFGVIVLRQNRLHWSADATHSSP